MIEIWDNDIQRIEEALQGKIRLVGGCVRDFILGRCPHDVDIATPIKPMEVQTLLKAAGIPSIPTSISHGVITALIEDRHYEITTLRMDKAHASDWIDSYEGDARRRDFTINAISMDKDGTIYDYLSGREDLEKHIVHFIGDPSVRIPEDPIRIYRYIRFWSLYGGKEPDAAVMAVAQDNRQGLCKVSRERRRREILKLLMSPRVIPALEALEKTNLLSCILPTARIDALHRFLQARPTADVFERLTVISQATGLAGVRLSDKEKARLTALQRPVVCRDVRALKLMLGEEGYDTFHFFLTRGWAWGEISDKEYHDLLAISVPDLPIRESDLTGYPGMKKARTRAEAMKIIRRIWVDLDFPAEKSTLLTEYKHYMKSIGRTVL